MGFLSCKSWCSPPFFFCLSVRFHSPVHLHLFFCVRLPDKGIPFRIFTGSVALNLSVTSNHTPLISVVSRKPCLAPLPIFQTDIFMLSRRHPNPVVL